MKLLIHLLIILAAAMIFPMDIVGHAVLDTACERHHGKRTRRTGRKNRGYRPMKRGGR